MWHPVEQAASMTQSSSPTLELDDIKGIILRDRPVPYCGAYLLLRIDNPVDGCSLLRRLAPRVASGVNWQDHTDSAWFNVVLTFEGLKALGVPEASLRSFAPEFREGMAARAARLGDVGESAPNNWEKPFGTTEVHVALSFFSGDCAALQPLLQLTQRSQYDLPGISVIYRVDIAMLPTTRTHFGYKDGIGVPLIEGSGSTGYPGQGPAIKAGEFILGYPDETGNLPAMPQPEILGRNGTYLGFRKLHSRVAAFRQYLQANARSDAEQELLAAKLVGRWPSGAPLVLAPERDDPALGADPQRNNDFVYYDSDPHGLRCPPGSHIRRSNPRDALKDQGAVVNLHRILRRGATYGPMLPEGVLEDDGVDRGSIFAFIGSSLARQFEFVKSQWHNDGGFIGLDQERDVIAGDNDGSGTFTIPERPIRRRLHGLPRFVMTRGGEYCFMPGIRALHWLASLHS
jgi:Dyp-type peroxidase family